MTPKRAMPYAVAQLNRTSATKGKEWTAVGAASADAAGATPPPRPRAVLRHSLRPASKGAGVAGVCWRRRGDCATATARRCPLDCVFRSGRHASTALTACAMGAMPAGLTRRSGRGVLTSRRRGEEPLRQQRAWPAACSPGMRLVRQSGQAARCARRLWRLHAARWPPARLFSSRPELGTRVALPGTRPMRRWSSLWSGTGLLSPGTSGGKW